MKNFNKTFENAIRIESIKNLVNALNDSILNNEEIDFSEIALKNALDFCTSENEKKIYSTICYMIDNTEVEDSRECAFRYLMNNITFISYSLIKNENSTYSINESKRLVKFAKLEKCYQLKHSKETNKNGKALPNKAVSVFGALRVYGLTDCFIRNCLKSNFEVDEETSFNLKNVYIDGETIFTEKDGICFSSNSNNALQSQINVIKQFFGFDNTYTINKKDIIILKNYAQKISRSINKDNDKKDGYIKVSETKTFDMLDAIFSMLKSRKNNDDIVITYNDGKKATDNNKNA